MKLGSNHCVFPGIVFFVNIFMSLRLKLLSGIGLRKTAISFSYFFVPEVRIDIGDIFFVRSVCYCGLRLLYIH